MVGMGVLMILLALFGLWLRKKGTFYDSKWLHKFALYMGPSGFIALLAGWFTTEVGRQPWIIYGVMRTKDALSPVSAEQVGLTLIIFVVVYCIVFGIGIFYMLKMMHKGPEFIYSIPHSDGEVIRASKRPMSAIDNDQQLDAPANEHQRNVPQSDEPKSNEENTKRLIYH